jgi:hypothetical protein
MPHYWLEVVWSRFCVDFLGPRTNAELVPKFQAALLASHVAIPTVTWNFGHYVAFSMLDQISLQYSPSYVIYKKINSVHMHYLYHRDERVLPGNLQNRRYSFFPPPNVVSLTTSPLLSLPILSLSVFIKCCTNRNVTVISTIIGRYTSLSSWSYSHKGFKSSRLV